MTEGRKSPQTIDEYIDGFTGTVRERLEDMRTAIRQAAPEAAETISYRMPAFALKSVLVYFAAFKNHIGFYPTASGIEAFQDQLKPYPHSKGAVQFSFDQPLPLELVREITQYRLKEVQNRPPNSKKTGPQK